jgi:hypothetical protein
MRRCNGRVSSRLNAQEGLDNRCRGGRTREQTLHLRGWGKERHSSSEGSWAMLVRFLVEGKPLGN